MNRRSLLQGFALGVLAAPLQLLLAAPAKHLSAGTADFDARLAALEQRHGGRLGVAILDTGTGRRAGYRTDDRFLMCSTFKLLAAAAVLARVDRGQERLDRRIIFEQADVLSWAPQTEHRTGPPGMTVAELCGAAVTLSDNTAANLLLASIGGPVALTRFARTFGDPATRLDRFEPELNVGAPGDLRDTTTTGAMLHDLRVLLLGDALSDGSRRQLIAWLRASRTGLDKLRAGVPPHWDVGDKTGSGAAGESNDVGILWPPRRPPVLVTAYYDLGRSDPATSRAVLAAVGHVAANLHQAGPLSGVPGA